LFLFVCGVVLVVCGGGGGGGRRPKRCVGDHTFNAGLSHSRLDSEPIKLPAQSHPKANLGGEGPGGHKNS
jgi:hypothetical protein